MNIVNSGMLAKPLQGRRGFGSTHMPRYWRPHYHLFDADKHLDAARLPFYDSGIPLNIRLLDLSGKAIPPQNTYIRQSG